MDIDSSAPVSRWWRSYPLPVGAQGRWALGPLHLGAEHLPSEIRLSWLAVGGWQTDTISVEHPCADPPHAAGAEISRFALQSREVDLTLRPVLPDRPIVARPATTLWVLGRQRVDLFVSTPLWLEANLGGAADPLLCIPSVRLSDTWFGPSPGQGELCYSTRTQARLDVTKLPRHPMRAVTRVTIDNRGAGPVRVERIKLPTQLLGLYATPDDRFWTTSIELEPPAVEGTTRVRLRAPEGGADDRFEVASKPRHLQHTNMFERALSALIG
jgi:hypothetical protein